MGLEQSIEVTAEDNAKEKSKTALDKHFDSLRLNTSAFPDETLNQMIQQGDYLATLAMRFRNDMRRTQQPTGKQLPIAQQTIEENRQLTGIGEPPINPDMISPDMIAGIGSPDMMPQSQPIGSGVGQLPAPMMMAAGGGLIELAGGGEVIPYQNEGLVEGRNYDPYTDVPFSKRSGLQKAIGFGGEKLGQYVDYVEEDPITAGIATLGTAASFYPPIRMGWGGVKGAYNIAKNPGMFKGALGKATEFGKKFFTRSPHTRKQRKVFDKKYKNLSDEDLAKIWFGKNKRGTPNKEARELHEIFKDTKFPTGKRPVGMSYKNIGRDIRAQIGKRTFSYGRTAATAGGLTGTAKGIESLMDTSNQTKAGEKPEDAGGADGDDLTQAQTEVDKLSDGEKSSIWNSIKDRFGVAMKDQDFNRFLMLTGLTLASGKAANIAEAAVTSFPSYMKAKQDEPKLALEGRKLDIQEDYYKGVVQAKALEHGISQNDIFKAITESDELPLLINESIAALKEEKATMMPFDDDGPTQKEINDRAAMVVSNWVDRAFVPLGRTSPTSEGIAGGIPEDTIAKMSEGDREYLRGLLTERATRPPA